MHRSTLFALLVFFVAQPLALADPFEISSLLSGDPRADNPDNLYVNVTIAGDTDSNTTYWDIALASPLHPDIKLDQFFFNLALDATSVVFNDFTPSTWSITTPADNAQGSGGADFLFTALDPAGPPSTDVNAAQGLAFVATLTTGNWALEMFENAPYSSGDASLGLFQLGAHLQSLVAADGQSDSGFATGVYGGGGTAPVPEPATMLLFGAGLVCLAGYSLRRHRFSA
jgi:hypothetical protein